MTPRLSIIIVSFNTREVLLDCLRSIASAPPAVSYDITVVDNASRDGSVDAVKQAFADVRVIAQETNLGFAAANNVGIRATSGELVLLLNSDTIVPKGSIERLAARLAAHPKAAAAGPKLVDGAGQTELSFGPMISPWGELLQKIRMRRIHAGHPGTLRWLDRATGDERYVDWVSGAALLVWRADAEAVGLLDERFFLYTEDVDFCASLRAQGRKILFTPHAHIVHLRGRSRATAPAQMNVAYRRSHIAFYEKHHPVWASLLRRYLRLKGQLPPAS